MTGRPVLVPVTVTGRPVLVPVPFAVAVPVPVSVAVAVPVAWSVVPSGPAELAVVPVAAVCRPATGATRSASTARWASGEWPRLERGAATVTGTGVGAGAADAGECGAAA